MKLEWTKDRKLNTKKLSQELGRAVSLIQPRCTDTVIDPETGEESFVSHEAVIEIAGDDLSGEEIEAALAAHAPAMTDAEEAAAAQEASADDAEKPRLKRRLLKALKDDADFRAKVKAALAL